MPRTLVVTAVGAATLGALVVLLFFIGRSIFEGPPACYVNFDGTRYEQAEELEAQLADRGYDVSLDGQPGGPGRALVVSAEDGGLFYGSVGNLEEVVRDELEGLPGGEIQTCTQAKLGD